MKRGPAKNKIKIITHHRPRVFKRANDENRKCGEISIAPIYVAKKKKKNLNQRNNNT